MHNSRPDNETCCFLDVRSLTNPPDLVILSHKTKGSVIPQQTRTGHMELVVWGFSEWFTRQNRTGQGGMRTELAQHALYVQLISVLLFGITFHLKILSSSLLWLFRTFFHKIFLNSYLCSHVCMQCHQSSSAAFSEWLQKQWWIGTGRHDNRSSILISPAILSHLSKYFWLIFISSMSNKVCAIGNP